MNYSSAVRYLESFVNYEKKTTYPYKQSLKLERVKDFLVMLGNPQNSFKSIHIAGTKGKGSVCAFIAYILKEAGFVVGLYTSPHLSTPRERIRILKKRRRGISVSACQSDGVFEGMISKDSLAKLVSRSRPKIEAYNKESPYGPLSFFEVYTALAFEYFKERKVDFAVLETGLGGRLDATNVVNALVAGITPISYDHTDKLGTTLAEIATEKAGIIKRCQGVKVSECQSVVVSARQEKEARQIIRERCKKTGARLLEVGRDIRYERNKNGFSVGVINETHCALRITLRGQHQIENAAMAVGITDALKTQGLSITAKQIQKGLYETRWPGRCEVVARRPLVVLDGAQNMASAEVLKKAVRSEFKYKKLVLVLGASTDKDIAGICGTLRPLADFVVLTKADNPRAAPPESLQEFFSGKEIQITQSVKEAKGRSFLSAKKKDLILVCGSLFVVAEFRNLCIKR